MSSIAQFGAASSDEESLVHRARESRLLAYLTGEDLTAAVDSARIMQTARGATLLPQGIAGLVLILDGAAKEQVVDTDGAVSIVGLHGPGDCSSLGTALENDDATEVESLEPVTALVWSAEAVRDLVETRPALAQAWFGLAIEQLRRAQHWSSVLSTASTRERVIKRLLELATTWGRPQGDAIFVDLPLTQDELAAWCGASRESTAKVLHDLRKARVLLTGRRELIVTDISGLLAREGRNGHRSLTDLLRASLA